MATCTFFGHKDCSFSVAETLKKTLIPLIEEHNATEFIVGNQGNFDAIASQVIKSLRDDYPQIKLYIISAYYPKETTENSIFPEGLENVPGKFRIDKRNRWMLKKADYVVTYITRSTGGAVKYYELAKKAGKTVINIADKSTE